MFRNFRKNTSIMRSGRYVFFKEPNENLERKNTISKMEISLERFNSILKSAEAKN